MSNTKFLIIYVIFMIPTYFWRYAFIGAAFKDDANIDGLGNTMDILMILSYAIMTYVTYSRGKAIGKGYLAAFPIVGAVFDFILIFIPLVPTVMNIITIVLGMPNNKLSDTSRSDPSTS